MEYLGFDPSTSSLLRTHASDCANTPGMQRHEASWFLKKATTKNKKRSHRGARTHDHKIKSLALYQLS